MTLNLRGLLLGKSSRLRFVHRFSTNARIHEESVAEHSWFVTWYALFIAEWYNSNIVDVDKNKVNLNLVMQYALLHDIEESITGDFPRDFKYSSTYLKQTLDTIGPDLTTKIFREFLSMADTVTYVDAWIQSKKGLEGAIVDLADFCSAVAYIWYETFSGNRAVFDEACLLENFHRFKERDFLVFHPLVEQLETLIMEIKEHAGHKTSV